MEAKAIKLATAPSLRVSHLDAEGNRYDVRYRGYETPEALLQNNPDCCEDVTEETRLEGIPPDEMRRLRIHSAIKVTSKWTPITEGFVKDYVRSTYYYFDRCGNRVRLPH